MAAGALFWFLPQETAPKEDQGFLMAMGIAGLVAITLAAILMFAGRSFAGLFNYVDLDDVNRIAMDVLTTRPHHRSPSPRSLPTTPTIPYQVGR